jgi:hypothetical protein
VPGATAGTRIARSGVVALVVLIATFWFGSAGAQPKTSPQADPLTSWNDGLTKTRILSFVADVTTPSSPRYVAAPDRIATFDQDGTLWAEHPLYAQAQFALDRLKELAPGTTNGSNKSPSAPSSATTRKRSQGSRSKTGRTSSLPPTPG